MAGHFLKQTRADGRCAMMFSGGAAAERRPGRGGVRRVPGHDEALRGGVGGAAAHGGPPQPAVAAERGVDERPGASRGFRTG